jgi:hypothetical protein
MNKGNLSTELTTAQKHTNVPPSLLLFRSLLFYIYSVLLGGEEQRCYMNYMNCSYFQ